MKKISLIVVAMLSMGALVYSADKDGSMSGFGGYKFWCTSYTMSNDDWVEIATGNIVIGFVQISSVGIQSDIKFVQFASTVDWKSSPSAGNKWEWNRAFGSTIPANGQWAIPTDKLSSKNGDLIYVFQESTAGWKYRTSGTTPAKIGIFWDYKILPE